MGPVKAENYPENGQCGWGYYTKRKHKPNVTRLLIFKKMLTITKTITVHILTRVYGQRKENCLNMLPVNMEMKKM